ncbi:cupin domain-containing protein [Hyphomonas sp.]|uniref:cupin domain-containing protein n=1 Tax=Hyphomonas sp. TaxID=87 RepID=UPI00391B8E85
MPRIDIAEAPEGQGTRYPAPFGAPCAGRRWRALGAAAGLTQFGVNLVTLDAGVWSSQRHWHTDEDEFVWVLEGEVVMVTDAGREVLRAGDCAGFPAGRADGHHFINESDAPARLLVAGSRSEADACHYSDIDMHLHPGRYDDSAPRYTRKDGTPF